MEIRIHLGFQQPPYRALHAPEPPTVAFSQQWCHVLIWQVLPWELSTNTLAHGCGKDWCMDGFPPVLEVAF